MPVLAVNQPIEQREPLLVVQNRLAVGAHRFALVVVNDRGVESAPDVLTVTVRRAVVVTPVDPRIDTPVLTPVRPPVSPVITPVRPPIPTPVGPPPRSRKGKKHGPE
jgi:hypothetical protein